MYSYEDKMRALELCLRYDRSAAAVVNELGMSQPPYPQAVVHGVRGNGGLSRGRHRRYDDLQKRAAVDHFFDHGQCPPAPSASSDTRNPRSCSRAGWTSWSPAGAVGVTRAVLYKWKNQLLGEEAPCKMEAAPKNTTDDVDALRSQAAELQEQIKRLELRKAILEGTVKLLGKGQGVDPGMLTNRKKALLANSLRPARKLNEILSELGMSRSSYQYQIEAMSRPDKHVGLRKRISEIFAASDGRYGYRRIRLGLRSEGVRVSEKVVARLMRELDLVAKRGKKRRYSSYKGEISDAPESLVKRNFQDQIPAAQGSKPVQKTGVLPPECGRRRRRAVACVPEGAR